MIIGIDFDGTIVKHEFPKIGDIIPDAIEVIRELVDSKHKIILWTMRSGETLNDAIEFLRKLDIPLFGINENPSQHKWTNSPKAYCQKYIDDAALGCPLIFPDDGGRPWVDWIKVRGLLKADKFL